MFIKEDLQKLIVSTFYKKWCVVKHIKKSKNKSNNSYRQTSYFHIKFVLKFLFMVSWIGEDLELKE